MRKYRKLLAVAVGTLLTVGVLAWGTACALPDTFEIDPGTRLDLRTMPWVRVTPGAQETAAPADAATRDASYNCTVKLFGVVPIKTVRAVETPRRMVQVSGAPFGVKLFSDGALVVAFSDQYTTLGTENPAKEAGLRLGDLIVLAGGEPIRTNEELTAAIAASAGKSLPIVYRRDGAEHTTTLTPVQDASTGVWRAGLWVRDSSAGVGTLTFSDARRKTFAGLGHAISDSDTGANITLLSGEIVPVFINGWHRGAAGAPGELRGEFTDAPPLGTVQSNDAAGVYGRLTGSVEGIDCPVALMQEVHPGEAELWTTIEGATPRAYKVRIERVHMTAGDPNRNLLVKVTDPALLRTTGGIVQGMSGSPVLQDGKLVGAVTHVLVNDPTRGYGIFAQTMLDKADAAA